ncbi:MAG TPA: 2TM domain-containing protein [Candidatus Nanoarchaeia archaeon]|nr:2TM domain-containing protein [Candidatus Nanoarchaeia archaeon]
MPEITLDEYKQAYRDIEQRQEKQTFFLHLIIYAAVNLFLIAVNAAYSPDAIWVVYVIFGWGIGVLMHYLFKVRWIEERLEEREARAEYKLR